MKHVIYFAIFGLIGSSFGAHAMCTVEDISETTVPPKAVYQYVVKECPEAQSSVKLNGYNGNSLVESVDFVKQNEWRGGLALSILYRCTKIDAKYKCFRFADNLGYTE